MEVKKQLSVKPKNKLAHSKSMRKPSNLELLIIPPKPELEPTLFSKTPKPRLQSRASQTKQNLLEMIGVQESPKQSNCLPGMKLSPQSSKISVTDFMGKNKFSLLKQAGMMDFFLDFRRNSELIKMISQKNVASFNNLMHHDSIREFCIKNPKSTKTPEIPSHFERISGRSMKGLQKVEKIEKIIGKCDEFFERSKEQSRICKRHKQDVQKILRPKKKNLKKIL
jgi:hypothetical protein